MTTKGIGSLLRLMHGISILCRALLCTCSVTVVGSQRRKLATASASFKLLAPARLGLYGKWAVAGPLPQVLPLTCAAKANSNVSSRLLHPFAFERLHPLLSALHIPSGVSP